MNHAAMTTVLITMLVTTTVGSQAGRTALEVGTRADEEAIKKDCLARIERFNTLHAAPSGFTPDADFVNVYGMWRKGEAEITAGQGSRMKTVLKDAKMTLIDLRVRFLKPDVALVHQLHEMAGMLTAAGDKMPPHQELSLRVIVKQDGKWVTTAFHNTIVRPPAAE